MTAAFSNIFGLLLHVPGGGSSHIPVSIGLFCEITICANTLKYSLFNAQKTAENDLRVLEHFQVLVEEGVYIFL